jgi:hypothetical protein
VDNQTGLAIGKTIKILQFLPIFFIELVFYGACRATSKHNNSLNLNLSIICLGRKGPLLPKI